jgi:hypothetical protein
MVNTYKYYDAPTGQVTNEFNTNYYDAVNHIYDGSILDSDDAAKAIMGGNWRIPSKNDWKSLIDNTNISLTTNYNNTNVPGYILTDKSDNTKVLFLPAVETYIGLYDDRHDLSFPYNDADDSYKTNYWTNQYGEYSETPYGYAQYFTLWVNDEIDYGPDIMGIEYGLPIRPVLGE